jgi:hypothetical protein
MDGAVVTAPNLDFWTPEEGFGVENVSIPSNVEVEQTPADVIAGKDPQLEKARLRPGRAPRSGLAARPFPLSIATPSRHDRRGEGVARTGTVSTSLRAMRRSRGAASTSSLTRSFAMRQRLKVSMG